MEAHCLDDPRVFRERSDALLLGDEARHNLILGISGILIDRPEIYPDYRLWVVEDGGRVAMAALMTVPYNLIISDFTDDGAYGVLARRLHDEGVEPPGVVGNLPTIDGFITAFTELTGVRVAKKTSQGIFRLSTVAETPGASGSPRPANHTDRELLLRWNIDFDREAFGDEATDLGRLNGRIDQRLPANENAGLWIWEDSEPVSMSGYGGPTPNGIRIGPVYTPPRFRGNGYATALVAAQSQWLLENGRRFCFLYTDLANPTSNAIYRRIGYHQVAESAEYKFNPFPVDAVERRVFFDQLNTRYEELRADGATWEEIKAERD